MRAIGYRTPGDASQLEDVELPDPTPGERDLLVEVRAVSVNPVDTKVIGRDGPGEGQDVKVLGWDVAGVVREVGSAVEGFAPGDEVWYAGRWSAPAPTASCTWSTSGSPPASRPASTSPRPRPCR